MSYTVPTQAAALDVALGPEKYVYERLLFGSASTKGVTAGEFYDMRGYPVPYTPNDVTDITVTLPKNSSLIGQNLKIEIVRDDPKTLPPYEAVFFAPSSEITSFGARLDLGLNFIKITNTDGDMVGSFSLSATRFATILYAIAVDIYTKVWEPIDSTSKEIFDTHTGLFSNLIQFIDLLPEASSRHLLSSYMSMRALVSKAGTEEGLTTLVQALFDQTPVNRKVEASDWSAEWLRPSPPTTLAQAGREVHVWSYDAVAARIVQFGKLCRNIGKTVTQDRYGAVVGDLSYDWSRYLDAASRSEQQDPSSRYDGHVTEIKTKVELLFPWDDGKRSIVQFPGMWDIRVPYFDQGTVFDQGSTLDTADTTGPLGFKGWVGVPVLPPPTFGEAASDGRDNMSVLIGVEMNAELQNSMGIQTITEASSIEWGSNAFSLDVSTPSSTLTSSTWSPVAHATVPATSLDSIAAIALVLTSSSEAGHAHSVPLLTVGQWKSVLNGATVTVTANFNQAGDHTHTITVSMVDLSVCVSITGNHGHLISISIPEGLGL